MTVLLGAAPSIIGPSEVGAWMAAKGAPGAAAVFDFTGQKYGLRNAAGVPRWGSVAGDMVFARASAAGRWPASGSYEMVGSGVLRYDHDPVTREPLGVRIERAATNLLTNSEIQNGLAGMSSALNATAITDFGGGRTGLRLSNATSTATAYKAVTATAGATYTIACDVEMEDGAPPVFGGAVNSASNTFAFNLGGSFYVPSRVEKIGVQVWRCFFSGVFGSTRPDAGVAQYETNEQRRVRVTGFQLEAGSLASSYIVTGASAVTRAAESLYSTLSFDPQNGITVAMKFRAPPFTVAGASILAALYNGVSTANLLNVYMNSGNVILAGAGSFLMNNTSLALGTIAPSSDQRLVMSVSPDGECRVSRNGNATLSRGLVSGAIPPGMTRLDLMHLGGTLQMQSPLARVAVWRGAPFGDAEFRGLLS